MRFISLSTVSVSNIKKNCEKSLICPRWKTEFISYSPRKTASHFRTSFSFYNFGIRDKLSVSANVTENSCCTCGGTCRSLRIYPPKVLISSNPCKVKLGATRLQMMLA